VSEIAIGQQGAQSPFRGLTVVLMLAVGVLAFIGMLVLGAYAPDFRSGRDGGAHALSNGATGFRALVELARATGRNPEILRDVHAFDTEHLLVVTPESGETNISAALDGREGKPTLFILPKWGTVGDPAHPGWVHTYGELPFEEPQGVLAPGIRFGMRRYKSGREPLVTSGLPAAIHFRAPQYVQAITGVATGGNSPANTLPLRPLVSDAHGGVLLAQLGSRPLFVLADPDLFNNIGMKDVDQAAAALAVLDWMNSNPPDGIAFDVSFNGLGHSRSPLKLLFEPPFLPLTLAIAAALLLTGLHGLARFGPIRPRLRAIAFGKAALVDNSAALVRKARRESRMGGRYAAMVRESAARVFGAPARLRDDALDAYLDALTGSRRFTELRQQAEDARHSSEVLHAAQALHAWQAEKMEKSK
jgi:hypothetical protein